MARGEPPPKGPRSQLPAPYRSPWRGLAEAMAAVGADLLLGLRALLRRNRQGELPRPDFWPGSLAPLFWPLLLLAAIALLTLAAARMMEPRIQGPSPASPAVAALAVDGEEPAPSPVAAGLPPLSADGGLAPPLPPPPGPAPERSAAAPGPTGEPRAATTPGGAGEPPSRPLASVDPLLALISTEGREGMLLAVRPDGDGGLVLLLGEAAERLTDGELLQQAERWQRRADEAGYERLELRDRQGRLRGRQALVGSGMILLAPAPAS